MDDPEQTRRANQVDFTTVITPAGAVSYHFEPGRTLPVPVVAALAPTPDVQADVIVAKVVERLSSQLGRSEPLLVNREEAARLLGISLGALDKRVQRHQVPGVVRTGQNVQFNRERLRAGIEKKTAR